MLEARRRTGAAAAGSIDAASGIGGPADGAERPASTARGRRGAAGARLRSSHLPDVSAQLAAAVVGRGCFVVLQIVLARYLGPRDFGLYAIGWTVAGLLSTLAPVGMPQAMLRYGIAGRSALTSLPVIVTIAAGGMLALGLVAAADLIATEVFGELGAAPVIRAFAPSVPLIALFLVLAAALRASGAMLSSAAVGAIGAAAHLAMTAIVFLAAPSTIAAAHLYTVSILVSLCLTVMLLAGRPSAATATAPGILLRFGLVTMFIHSASVLNLLADRVVIGIMSNPETVGIYQVAAQLAAVIIVLRSAVTIVFETSAAKLQARSAAAPDVTREFFAATRILLHAAAPGLAVLAITAGFWVDLLFGPAFLAAALPLAILVVGQLAASFTGPAVTALHMTGKERLMMALTLSNCALNVVGNVLLIPALGAAGAAIASAISNVAIGLVSLIVLCRTGRLRFSLRRLMDIVLGTAACAATCFLVVAGVGELSVVTAALALGLAYLVYGLVVLMTCAVEDEVVGLARNALRRRLSAFPRRIGHGHEG